MYIYEKEEQKSDWYKQNLTVPSWEMLWPLFLLPVRNLAIGGRKMGIILFLETYSFWSSLSSIQLCMHLSLLTH